MVSIPWRSIKKFFFFSSLPRCQRQLSSCVSLMSSLKGSGARREQEIQKRWCLETSENPRTGYTGHPQRHTCLSTGTPWIQSQPQKGSGGRQGTPGFNGSFTGKAIPISILIRVQTLGHSVMSCQHQEALPRCPGLQSSSYVLSCGSHAQTQATYDFTELSGYAA